MDQKGPYRRTNGEGTIYFDEKYNRWICQITYTNLLGEKKRKSISGRTKTEVVDKKNKFIEDNALGLISVNTNVTICMLLKAYIDNDYKLNLLKESSYVRKLYNYSIIEEHIIGKLPVNKITDKIINNFLTSLTNYSNSTINKTYQLLKKGFELAVENRYISFNPLNKSTIKKPLSKRPNKKVKAFTIEEQNIFLDNLNTYHSRNNRNNYVLQLKIELFSGMRMGEINALKIEDIDLKNNVINVSRTITRGVGYKEMLSDTTKTENGVRQVPINSKLKDVLTEAIKQYQPNKYELLFYDINNDKLITTGQVNNFFSRICKKWNLPFYGQHMLRHTFATRCIESGVRSEVLKNWLGHSDISITIDTYCDIFNNLQNNSIEMFESYLEKQSI